MKRRTLFAATISFVASVAFLLPFQASAKDASVLRVVPPVEIAVFDPFWTSAAITRDYGYMVYDTLFSVDGNGVIQPQMVERYTTSEDGLTWSFVLRDGLAFHDGKPVTSDDVVASLKRWSQRDTLGGAMAEQIARYDITSDKSFSIVFSRPFGLVLQALGKNAANVPFILPADVAATPASEKISSHVGSGPFIFVAEEYEPGRRVVFKKNPNYIPRDEPPSGLAGGHVVNFERVEWVSIRDTQTQSSALTADEVDVLWGPSFSLFRSLQSAPGIELQMTSKAGGQFAMHFNFLHPPLDNEAVRRAAILALGQQAILNTQIGVPEISRTCASMYPCGTPYAKENTTYFSGKAEPAKARALLAEAGYDGTPIVILDPAGHPTFGKIGQIAKQQLQAAGFNVELERLDWAALLTRRANKALPSEGGWSAFITAWGGDSISDPISMLFLDARGADGWVGWHDDARFLELRRKYTSALDDASRADIAEQIQQLAFETGTYAPLGEFQRPLAKRTDIGDFLVAGGSLVFWGVSRN